MQDIPFFRAAVQQQYGKQPVALHALRDNNPDEKRLYRVEFADGTSWVLRAYRRDFTDHWWFAWFSHYETLQEWLQTRASTQAYVAELDYPAPRVIPTQDGAFIGDYQKWYIFMTDYIHGDAKETTPEKMQALGASLAHLHTLPLPDGAAGRVGLSWWEPATAIPYALDRLVCVAELIPPEWRAFADISRRVLTLFQQHSGLARTITHSDCWAENAVLTQPDLAIMIDWECAGSGLAIVDLGSLLLHCHFDQRGNAEYLPDPTRIAAVVNGYLRWRRIPPDELAVLVEAVRFSIAWRCVMMVSRIEREGWHDGLQRTLAYWWRWYGISEEVARIAHNVISSI